MIDLIPNSLQRRLLLFILLPVALVLSAVGTGGFIYARNQLLDHWGEATLLKLQRTAHLVDMRLSRPKTVMMMFQHLDTPRDLHHARTVLIRELMSIDGVQRVNFDLQAPGPHAMGMTSRRQSNNAKLGQLAPWRHIFEVTSPTYDDESGARTVSLVTDFKNAAGKPVGRLEVVFAFDALLTAMAATDGWKAHRAYLLDDRGRVLVQANVASESATNDEALILDDKLLAIIQERSEGAVIGDVLPPPVVTGFHRLHEAPWTLVIQAPGEVVLAPILKFRLLYFLFGAILVAGVLVLIRSVTAPTLSDIKRVSQAATQIARGSYQIALPPSGKDEVGELIHSFTTMATQLEERSRMKDSLHLAMEVQQQLLPKSAFCVDDLCIAGVCEYCDETGGDFYDFLDPQLMGDGRVGIAVGDVSGHGVAAALLMTTARALIRSQVSQHKAVDDAATHVNHLLIRDTEENSSFVTLFLAAFDVHTHTIEWVRCGHDPALLYDPAEERFKELGGQGVALGLRSDWTYARHQHAEWRPGQVVLIGTDGVWETESPQGERFGKERVKAILRRLGEEASAETIVKAILQALKHFRGGGSSSDDATLVAVRWRPTAMQTSTHEAEKRSHT